MPTIDYNSEFWNYLHQNQKDLIREGKFLLSDVITHEAYQFKDYSFVVFPLAKAYEGFLKQIFFDSGLISRLDYISDHIRLGKLLSPHLVRRLGEHSLFEKIRIQYSEELANMIWTTWKKGRNEVFHYFPHNIRAVNFEEAKNLIEQILTAMEETYKTLKPNLKL